VPGTPPRSPSDITLVNWPQIDYWLGPLVGVTSEQQRAHMRGKAAEPLPALLDADRSATPGLRAAVCSNIASGIADLLVGNCRNLVHIVIARHLSDHEIRDIRPCNARPLDWKAINGDTVAPSPKTIGQC
jgi:hypothetical protein